MMKYSSYGRNDTFGDYGKMKDQKFTLDIIIYAFNGMEIGLVGYCESLEGHGNNNVEEIQRKVVTRRKGLGVEYGTRSDSINYMHDTVDISK